MRSIQSVVLTAVFFSLASLAQAAGVNGTVINKTTGKPASGDKVELIDVQAGMGVAATAKTDSSGHYTLNKPGNGPYLVRVIHQGSPYFIAAPEGNATGDIPVFDAAPNVSGISIEANVIECEAENGQLRVTERYFVHNTSSPQRTQYNPSHGFEIVLPPDAVVDGTAARRPTGLPTSMTLKPSGKNHFQFDFPIQPDEGDKNTLFQISYHVPYSSGSYTFKPQMLLKADNVAFLLPKSISFKGAGFQSVQQDPGIQTQLAKNVQPGQELTATISGTGSMPREAQGQPQSGGEAASQDAAQNGPGGGIGQPINTPDPLSKYKWWILLGMFLALAAVAGFLLRRPAAVAAGDANVPVPEPNPASPPRRSSAVAASGPAYAAQPVSPASHNAALLAVLKEEMFDLESEKLSGAISPNDYQDQKAALETVLKRALTRK